MEKRSQVFVFDLILSLVILVVSLVLVFSFFFSSQDNIDIYDYNYQILSGLTQTKINSLNDEDIRDFFVLNKIKNIENSVAQQIGDFYYQGQFDDAQNITRIFVSDYVSNAFNIDVSLNNGSGYYVLFLKNSKSNVAFENSSVASVTSRSVFGFLNQSSFYGPYEFRVRIWI